MKTKYGLRPVIRIKELLDERQLTQKEFAEQMGETPQQVNKWVMGVEPCLNALGRIAITLGIGLSEVVWHKGDDAHFGPGSVVYIRGEVAKTICDKIIELRKDGNHKPYEPQDLMDDLKQYYRWTDEECAGVRLIEFNPQKTEIVLGCNSQNAEAFITWAKRDRDDMYRL